MPISPLWSVLYSTSVIYFHRSRTCFCCLSRSSLTDANISPVGCFILDICYLFSQVHDLLLLSIQKLLTDANISPVGCFILDFCYLFSQVQDLLLLSIQKLFNRCQYLLCGVFYTRLLLFIFTGPGLAFVVYPEAL
jgi:hypothetical protein